MSPDEDKDSSSGKSDSKDSSSGKSDSKDSSSGKSDSKNSSSGKSDSKDSSSGKSDSKSSVNSNNNNNNDNKSDAKSSDKSKEKFAKSDNDTKEVRKLFDTHVKAGDPYRTNGGLSMENTKRWFEEAGMIDDDEFGITEENFEKGFKATARGEDLDNVEFLEFIELIEMLADEISKSPQELYNKLLTVDTPSES